MCVCVCEFTLPVIAFLLVPSNSQHVGWANTVRISGEHCRFSLFGVWLSLGEAGDANSQVLGCLLPEVGTVLSSPLSESESVNFIKSALEDQSGNFLQLCLFQHPLFG